MKKIATLFLCAICFSFQSAESANDALKVIFFGTGEVPGGTEVLNQEAFAKLLKKIKEEKPDLVFFTGYLMMGLEHSTTPESLQELKIHFQTFSRFVKTYLGEEIPLYPVLGNHSLTNTEAVKIFQEHFNIERGVPLEPYQLAYVVKAKNVKFTVLATGDYERVYRGYLSESRSMPILHWLEKELRTHTNGFDFQFVINHEPAFSSGEAEGMFFGLDKDRKRRDGLWNVLKANDVRGYLCSHELIYDRSNRGGVWQVISGGIGKSNRVNHIFEHYVIISIPNNKNENPTARAVGLNGEEWDKFEMMHVDRPVHHLRISRG